MQKRNGIAGKVALALVYASLLKPMTMYGKR